MLETWPLQHPHTRIGNGEALKVQHCKLSSTCCGGEVEMPPTPEPTAQLREGCSACNKHGQAFNSSASLVNRWQA